MVRLTLKQRLLDTFSFRSSLEDRDKVSLLQSFGGHTKTKNNLRYYCCRDYCPCIPARYVLSIMGFFGFVIVYALRVNMSVAIVAMAKGSSKGGGGNVGDLEKNESNHSTNPLTCHPSAPQYSWTPEEQGWILSAFFYGYLITQIPGGYLATRFSGKHIYGLGIFLTSVLTLLTPLAAQWSTSIGPLVALRALEGLCEGVTFPAMYALLGKWAPPLEKSRMSTLVLSGSYVGNVISFPLTGYLCQCGFGGGWPSVFYTFGLSGVVWYVFWLFLAYETPASHPRISYAEMNYIHNAISTSSRGKVVSTPWWSIMTSWAVWGIIIVHFCNNWGYYTLLTCLPTYLKDTQKGVDIQSNGLLSGIPYLCQTLMSIIWGQVTDFLRGKGLPTVVARKANTFLGLILPALFLLINSYFGSNLVMFIVFLSLAIGSVSFTASGFNCNHLDIAPRYSGVIMGITNCFATIPGIVGPFVAKLIANADIANTEALREQWREVFFITAEIYVFGTILYMLLGKGELQSWAQHEDSDQILAQNKVDKVEKGCETPTVPRALQTQKKQAVNT